MTYVCDFFHVADHFIVALSLLAEPGEKGFAIASLGTAVWASWIKSTFRAVERERC